MDTEELDDLIEDGDDVTDYRARARAELDRIARLTKHALAEHGIDDLTVFFMIQSSGPLLTFGTMTDPPPDQWEEVSEIVLSIVREVTGLDGLWSRPVMCASTEAVASNEHSPIPMPMVTSLGEADQ
jgi:hypothetical protein